MKHSKPTRAWRPVRARRPRQRAPQDVLSAFLFNLCIFFLPVAAATAFIVISRDQLYAYEYSEAGARAVSDRVERLNGELIQLDFDRQRQWDDLVAMELMAGDVSAARGFLLSAPGMLPPRQANRLDRAAPERGGDAALELAALEFLTPGTRSRYEGTVPLLSRRAASGAAERRDPASAVSLGDERDFQLLARAMAQEPDADALQFLLNGIGLGLAGQVTPQMMLGGAALLSASRREEYPATFGTEISALVNGALRMSDFRTHPGIGDEAGGFANAAAAFRAGVSAQGVEAFKLVLSEIGEMAEATSVPATAAMLTHATTLADLPRLKLVAQAAGDRAAAAAKRLPRDGRLLGAARGELTMTRDLASAFAAAGLAFAGLILVLGFLLFRIGRRIWMRMQDDDYSGELVDISANNWRPL